ncbi:threonine dehydratase [Ferroacidibacillus organovorans]|uniref:L-threonine dehydratase catabolic TdcB n=1 Tax=Ferroacidibacillus organovorans TaxID=1765683 RepID=A0A162TUJ0_9BACL|nr:threonine ammonia-lyase [Ferroacidibacillus organovorans]KYP81146.1 threonine ammonia-lyase [Ferroacidibacillus organovorans]OAG87897.1 threonine dehydratase [Ferroacidibacillus organovorans]OPG16348.1 threonine ammonia-lyase [Ferroacidibacillus organovorans]
MIDLAITIEDIKQAQKLLTGICERTPLDFSHRLSELAHRPVYLKLENLQRTGSFKIRGAYNKIQRLSKEAQEVGVIAASAGNHAQGVAFAANALNIPCHIVMPSGAPLSKVEATRSYGATVTLHGADFDTALDHACALQKKTGMTFIPAFDDDDIIAGQGTVALEILEQQPDLESVVAAIGGGGLISGIAIALKALKPSIKIYGVEASGAACVTASLAAGCVTTLDRVSTIADGIAVKRPGVRTYEVIRNYVDDVVCVDDEEIARAMVVLLERCKVVSEGASAAAVAAVITDKLPKTTDKTAVILSGGNVDVSFLSRIIEHGLSAAGRFARYITTISDRPGSLMVLLRAVAETGVNIVSIEHHRLGSAMTLGHVEVQLSVETRDLSQIKDLSDRLSRLGYHFTIS